VVFCSFLVGAHIGSKCPGSHLLYTQLISQQI